MYNGRRKKAGILLEDYGVRVGAHFVRVFSACRLFQEEQIGPRGERVDIFKISRGRDTHSSRSNDQTPSLMTAAPQKLDLCFVCLRYWFKYDPGIWAKKRGQATYLSFEAGLLVLLFVPVRISWRFSLSIPDLQEDVLG